ncbi:MAG: NUDIX domain-containing protein [Candidatus Aenigmatarchaeota archaeon]
MSLKSWIVWHGKNIGYGILSKILWPRASAAAIVVDDQEMLAIDTGDYLMLPGGGLDSGESFEDAVIRETYEETGYRINVETRIEETINSVGGVELIFRATVAEGKAKGNWEGEPTWISIEDAASRRWRHDRNIRELLTKVNL